MRVTEVETLRLDEFPNLLFVRLRTDEGLTGLGETFFGAQAAEAYIHETAAPYLPGTEALHIDRHAKELYGYLASQRWEEMWFGRAGAWSSKIYGDSSSNARENSIQPSGIDGRGGTTRRPRQRGNIPGRTPTCSSYRILRRPALPPAPDHAHYNRPLRRRGLSPRRRGSGQ